MAEKLLNLFSQGIIPALVVLVLLYGLYKKKPLFSLFTKGAWEGLRTVAHLVPTLVGLLAAIQVLRDSGFLDFLSTILEKPAEFIHIPAELVPLITVRLFSSSAATGLALDLFEQFGVDSLMGKTAALLLCCTETVFYVMSVYFLATANRGKKQVTKTRWTLAGALFATAAGIAASLMLARIF